MEEEEVMQMINDIRKYLINRNDYETNQQYIGFKTLFRSYMIKNYQEANFNIMKYRKLNKILIKQCVQYYLECWMRRNEVLHDADFQKQRLRKWYEDEKEKGLNGDYEQVRSADKLIKEGIIKLQLTIFMS